MLELKGNTLVFSFPEVHPDAQLTISFKRTCRIPDDGKQYPLPGSLGNFPLEHVDDYRKRVPHEWKRRGGIMLPMYQSEAMWLHFQPKVAHNHRGAQYPFAVKVAAGKRSAITGKTWSKKLKKGDYLVAPLQRWLDGFVVEEGMIRQFVAMPLGMGATVEEQLTGEAEWGGLQIEVMPMKREVFERRFPKYEPPYRSIRRRSRSRGIGNPVLVGDRSLNGIGIGEVGYGYGAPDSLGVDGSVLGSSATASVCNSAGPMRSMDMSTFPTVTADMGLGAGGTMKQDIKQDPYEKKDWFKKGEGRRCYVHLANSLSWQAITSKKPPTAPLTAKDYKQAGLPWFDTYKDGSAAVKAKAALKGVKSVLEHGFQHGIPTLPENESVKIKRVNMLRPKKVRGVKKSSEIREGAWAEPV